MCWRNSRKNIIFFAKTQNLMLWSSPLMELDRESLEYMRSIGLYSPSSRFSVAINKSEFMIMRSKSLAFNQHKPRLRNFIFFLLVLIIDTSRLSMTEFSPNRATGFVRGSMQSTIFFPSDSALPRTLLAMPNIPTEKRANRQNEGWKKGRKSEIPSGEWWNKNKR